MILTDSNIPMYLVGAPHRNKERAQRAKELLLGRYGISARDALHVAVMEAHGIEEVLSFDTGFDRVPGVRRLA